VQADGEHLPFADGAFDLVYCVAALHHALDLSRMVSELARVTRPGGTVIVSMLNPHSPYRLCERLMQRLRDARSAHPFMPRIERLYTVREICALLRRNRLLPDEVIYYDINLCLPPLDQRLPRFAQDVAERFEFLAQSRLRALGTAFLVRCHAASPSFHRATSSSTP